MLETPQPSSAALPERYATDVSAFNQRQVPSGYRCVDRTGAVSLQSQSGGPGQRTTTVVAAPSEVEPRRYRPVSRPNATNHAAESTFRLQRDAAHAGRMAACTSARQQREATLEQIGLKRTYALLQQLDAMVNNASQGV